MCGKFPLGLIEKPVRSPKKPAPSFYPSWVARKIPHTEINDIQEVKNFFIIFSKIKISEYIVFNGSKNLRHIFITIAF